MLTPAFRVASSVVVDTDLWPDDFGFDEGDSAELDAALCRATPRQVLQVGSGSTTLLLAAYAHATGASIVTLEPVPDRRDRTLGLLSACGLLGWVTFDDCGAPGALLDPAAPPMPPLRPKLIVMDGKSFDNDGIAGLLDAVAGFVDAGAELWVSRGSEPDVAELVCTFAAGHGWHVEQSSRRYRLLIVRGSRLTRSLVDGSDVIVTVLTGGRASLLQATLDAALTQVPGLLQSARVIAFHNGDDDETANVLDRYSEVVDIRIGGDSPTVGIGAAISRLAEYAHGSGLPYWLHLEDDWAAHTWEPSWLVRARDILATAPEAHQVRLRHIGDRIQRDNFVTGEIVTWETAGDVRVSNNANWTFNPTLVRTSQIPFVYPVAGEANACRKATAAGLSGIVQLLPGTFSHLGLNDSLRRRTGTSG